VKDKLILFVAQGFGVGRIPCAPGTWGSVVGLGWFALLLWPGSFLLFVLGTMLGLVASVWFCGRGEKILGETDPGSIVLDEIAAIPVCFALLLTRVDFQQAWTNLFCKPTGMVFLLAGFALFRLFDIWKPWPVKQSQKLPGGWGVTVDDLLAALYVNLCCALLLCGLIFLAAR
jgi:phosphatidylglycerophosphatase A